MSYLKLSVIGLNLWSVHRGAAKVGEVTRVQSTAEIRFIPANSYAFTAEELNGISASMDEVIEDRAERARR